MRSLHIFFAILAVLFLVTLNLNEGSRVLDEKEEEEDNCKWAMRMMMKDQLKLQSLAKGPPPSSGPNPPIPGGSSTSTITQKSFAGRRALPPPPTPANTKFMAPSGVATS